MTVKTANITPDLVATMSAEDLTAALAILAKEQEKRKTAKKTEAINTILALAKENGLDLNEVAAAAASKKRELEIKFRHPDDPKLTWTGRGRAPQWLMEAEAQGKSRADFAVS